MPLDGFLAGLSRDALPSNWREEWEAFVIEQQTQGFTVDPTSVEEMKTWIESWAREFDLWPEEPIQVAIPKLAQPPLPIRGARQRVARNAMEDFVGPRLKLADECYVELERVLNLLGQKLDAVRVGEEVSIDTEVRAIEELIWLFNDARESALDGWIRHDLPDGVLTEIINNTRIPAHLRLPPWTDPSQLARAQQQASLIGRRLTGRDQAIGRLIFGMKVAETAGTAAGWLLLGSAVGTVIVKSTGKWVFAKGAAKIAASVGAGVIADRVVESGLRAAGASEEFIQGARLAAAVVSFALAKRGGKPGIELDSTSPKQASRIERGRDQGSKVGEVELDPFTKGRPNDTFAEVDAPKSQPRHRTTPALSKIPESYINRNYVVDMVEAPPSSKTNAAGFPRNGPWFWRRMLERFPELFSDSNKRLIRRERSPVVDDTWLRQNPAHGSFQGEMLIHHHIEQGSTATPLPESVHVKWANELHSK